MITIKWCPCIVENNYRTYTEFDSVIPYFEPIPAIKYFTQERVIQSENLNTMMRYCLNSKNFISGLTLSKNYDMASSFLKLFFKKKNKCPFHFWRK